MDNEDTSIGGVTWHCSDEDTGPDVGLSVYLGENDRLWCGEISRSLFEHCRGADSFDSDFGWFLIRYAPNNETCLIAKFADAYQAREFIEQIALWVREYSVPTMAKTLGDMERANG